MGLPFRLEQGRERREDDERRGSLRRSSSVLIFSVSWVTRCTSCCVPEADRGAVA